MPKLAASFAEWPGANFLSLRTPETKDFWCALASRTLRLAHCNRLRPCRGRRPMNASHCLGKLGLQLQKCVTLTGAAGEYHIVEARPCSSHRCRLCGGLQAPSDPVTTNRIAKLLRDGKSEPWWAFPRPAARIIDATCLCFNDKCAPGPSKAISASQKISTPLKNDQFDGVLLHHIATLRGAFLRWSRTLAGIKPKGACDPWRAAVPAHAGLRQSRNACGSHAAACEPACWVDTYVSRNRSPKVH